MKKILILITAIIMMAVLTSCFENSPELFNVSGSNTGTAGDKKGDSFGGEYMYNPPKDNYLVKWTYYNADGTEGGFDIYARIGQGHTLNETRFSNNFVEKRVSFRFIVTKISI